MSLKLAAFRSDLFCQLFRFHDRWHKCLYGITEEFNPFLWAAVTIPLQVDQTSAVGVSLAPCRGAVGGDDTLAALEGFGDDKTEVLGEGREDEDVAPVPDLLELIAKGGRDIFNAEAQRRVTAP